MDYKTKQFYATHASDLSSQYNVIAQSEVVAHCERHFEPYSTVLEIGFGSGRDLAALSKCGYAVHGVDASQEMVNVAKTDFPEIADALQCVALPTQNSLLKNSSNKADNILCSAVVMHIPDEELLDFLFTIKRNLANGGKLVLTYPVKRPGVDEDHRASDGRLFQLRSPQEYRLLFERLGFVSTFIGENGDSLNREGYHWGVQVFTLQSDAIRSLDTVESVLNRDRKTATYKLALFRALVDIAAYENNSVVWNLDGTVTVSLNSVAEYWLLYYWPLLASDIFIPQNNTESFLGSGKQLKFRSEMSCVIKKHAQKGVTLLLAEYRNGSLSLDDMEEVKRLIKLIGSTIVKGPVEYSGGATGVKIFNYNSAQKGVQFSSDMWRELSVMGYWIRDSLLCRWAELTVKFSKDELQLEFVLSLLLSRFANERTTNYSHTLFDTVEDLQCVWSGKSLSKGYHIDHILPYSLWQNNEIWNLLPADQEINGKKSDKLPTRELFEKRRDALIFCWSYLSKSAPNRFSSEVARFTGKPVTTNWENILFHSVVDAVELTALQRGVQRWSC